VTLAQANASLSDVVGPVVLVELGAHLGAELVVLVDLVDEPYAGGAAAGAALGTEILDRLTGVVGEEPGRVVADAHDVVVQVEYLASAGADGVDVTVVTVDAGAHPTSGRSNAGACVRVGGGRYDDRNAEHRHEGDERESDAPEKRCTHDDGALLNYSVRTGVTGI